MAICCGYLLTNINDEGRFISSKMGREPLRKVVSKSIIHADSHRLIKNLQHATQSTHCVFADQRTLSIW